MYFYKNQLVVYLMAKFNEASCILFAKLHNPIPLPIPDAPTLCRVQKAAHARSPLPSARGALPLLPRGPHSRLAMSEPLLTGVENLYVIELEGFPEHSRFENQCSGGPEAETSNSDANMMKTRTQKSGSGWCWGWAQWQLFSSG